MTILNSGLLFWATLCL